MLGGGRTRVLYTIAKAFPNTCIPLRSSSQKPTNLCFQYAPTSSLAKGDDRNHSSVADKDVEDKAEESMTGYVGTAKEKPDSAKDRTKEKAKEGAELMSKKMKDTAEEALDKTKEYAETAEDKTEEAMETAENVGEMVKQTMKEAPKAMKDATQKLKETLAGKDAEETLKDALKDVGRGATREDVQAARDTLEEEAKKYGKDKFV